MPSNDFGKDWVVRWIRDNFPKDSTILDVGACDGKWRRLLSDYPNMDAVEIFEPNAERIRDLYRNVFCADVAVLQYEEYDLIIFGDVIEHMPVETAQRVLKYAESRCKDMIVALPYLFPQGPIYGNPWEVHVQDDLTPETVAERYPNLTVLYDTRQNYCFYHRRVT